MKKNYLFLSILFAIGLFYSFEQEDSEKESAKAGKKMQDFVINLSKYARKFDADFIVIPQNGSELAFQNVQPDKPLCK
jgi:cysteinyl-tRNA synthetase